MYYEHYNYWYIHFHSFEMSIWTKIDNIRFVNVAGSNDYVNNYLQPFMVAGQEYSHDEFVDVLTVTLEQQLVVLAHSLNYTRKFESFKQKKILKKSYSWGLELFAVTNGEQRTKLSFN